MSDGNQGTGRKKRELLLSLPGLVVTTVVVGLVSWGVTRLTTGADALIDEGPPAVVSVETNPLRVGAFDDAGVFGVLPEGARPATGPGGDCTAFHDWLLDNGGTDAGTSRLQVTVQGNATRQVQIANLRVVVVSRAQPPPSVEVTCPSAGDASLRTITVDLDSPQPRAEYASGDGTPFGFTVETGEIETFLVTATAERALYEWYLEFDLVSGSERTTLRADDDGRNFRTAPLPPARGWLWDRQGWDAALSGERRAVGDALTTPAGAADR